MKKAALYRSQGLVDTVIQETFRVGVIRDNSNDL